MFFVYENWTAENKAVIHLGTCGHCRYGKACHERLRSDKNGLWHGPFDTREYAEKIATATGRTVKVHRCVTPGQGDNTPA